MEPTTQGLDEIVQEMGVTWPQMAYATSPSEDEPEQSFRHAEPGDEFAVESFDHAIYSALLKP